MYNTHTHTHTQPSEDHHKLTCFYYTNKNNPRLILRPAKVEVAFPNPKIYILRDIISKPEMARLKELAEPKVGWHGNCIVHFETNSVSHSDALSPSDMEPGNGVLFCPLCCYDNSRPALGQWNTFACVHKWLVSVSGNVPGLVSVSGNVPGCLYPSDFGHWNGSANNVL